MPRKAVLKAEAQGERSQAVAERVRQAVARQAARYQGQTGITHNVQLRPGMFERFCRETEAACQELLRQRVLLGLSSQGVHKLRAVSRTTADLASWEAVEPQHVRRAAELVAGLDTNRKELRARA